MRTQGNPMNQYQSFFLYEVWTVLLSWLLVLCRWSLLGVKQEWFPCALWHLNPSSLNPSSLNPSSIKLCTYLICGNKQRWICCHGRTECALPSGLPVCYTLCLYMCHVSLYYYIRSLYILPHKVISYHDESCCALPSGLAFCLVFNKSLLRGHYCHCQKLVLAVVICLDQCCQR